MVEEAGGIESIFGGHGDVLVERRPHLPVGERVIDQRKWVMSNQSNYQGLSGIFIRLGVLLMMLGVLFLVVQAVGFDLGRLAWPFYVIVPARTSLRTRSGRSAANCCDIDPPVEKPRIWMAPSKLTSIAVA
jgi:hypothetical protein